jgi:hypothetical protein
MPARQATPGPSTGIILLQQQTNTRKRSISDLDKDGGYNKSKKPKQDEEYAVAKDKSKKSRARKRKRKQSVTTPQMSPGSKSRSVPPTQQKPSSSLLDAQSSVPPDSQVAEMSAVQDAAPDVVSHILYLTTVKADDVVCSLVRTKEKERPRSRMKILHHRRHHLKHRRVSSLPRLKLRDLRKN